MPIHQTELYYFLQDTLLNILSILILLRLYRHVFGSPVRKQSFLCCEAVLLILLSTLILKLILAKGRPGSLPPFTILLSFLFLPKYPVNRQKKILFGIVLFSLSGLLLILGDFLLTPLHLFYAAPICHIVFWLLLGLIHHIGKYEDTSIPFQLWFLLLFIAFSSVGVLILIFHFAIIRDNPYELTTEIPVLTVLLFINISLFIFFDRFSLLSHRNREKTLLEQQLLMQRHHYRELETAYHQLRTMKHDMKNHLHTASLLAKKNDNGQALLSFLEQAYGQLEHIEQVISTGNDNIDSVLNIKLTDMNQHSISVNTNIQIPPRICFSFEQSVTILGNLLDNAIEACQALPPKNRKISIKLRYTGHSLFLKIANSSPPITAFKDGLPVSTKTAKEIHGIGLKNVQKMIGDSGTMNIQEDSGIFQVQVIFYDIETDFNKK